MKTNKIKWTESMNFTYLMHKIKPKTSHSTTASKHQEPVPIQNNAENHSAILAANELTDNTNDTDNANNTKVNLCTSECVKNDISKNHTSSKHFDDEDAEYFTGYYEGYDYENDFGEETYYDENKKQNNDYLENTEAHCKDYTIDDNKFNNYTKPHDKTKISNTQTNTQNNNSTSVIVKSIACRIVTTAEENKFKK